VTRIKNLQGLFEDASEAWNALQKLLTQLEPMRRAWEQQRNNVLHPVF